MRIRSWPGLVLTLVTLISITTHAQAPLHIFTDHVANGFRDFSWATTTYTNAPVHSGSASLSASPATVWDAVSFWRPDFDASVYANVVFWAHGGPTGGQRLQAIHEIGGVNGPRVVLPTFLTSAWQRYSVPLSALGVSNDFSRVHIQIMTGGTLNDFYVDDVYLEAAPAPNPVHVSVDATMPVRAVDNRWFGVNTAIWDAEFEKPETVALLGEMGTTALRFPGGGLSDRYHWKTGTTDSNTTPRVTSFAAFAHAATSLSAEVFITVNYGTGTPDEAADWVRHANVTNALGFTYWEIGNENYSTNSADTNILPNHAYTYATRAQDYIQQMRAADPTIKVGVPVVTGENSRSNGYTDHPAVNPRTGETNFGWTAVLLTTLKDLGVTPDFVVYHHYPTWNDPNIPADESDSDVFLLQSTSNWAEDAADLRQQIEDYFGPGGTNIELVVTENNSKAGRGLGRQSTSLVNGLYYADSLCRLMQTEFNAFVWWNLRNASETSGSFDLALYGWRAYGDYGILNGLDTKHPSFYAAKLMRDFARGDDTVLEASSDYNLLSAYAARRANGSVSLLVLNKDTITSLNAEITVTGFAPDSSATVRSYGIPQDEAARTNGPAALQDIAQSVVTNVGATFTHAFPPLSMTLFTLAPEPSELVPLPQVINDAFALDLHGQSNVPYIIEASSDAVGWLPVSTNILTGSTITLTNPAPPGVPVHFWRATWRP